MKERLEACKADGGGDHPEAVADALHQVSKLSWREEATKICVFISDAPPHGLDTTSIVDGFPNGCPLGFDPMEISRIIAHKGITMYMVGCEPCITRHRDFFMAIAYMTGGQYVPLRNAKLLSKVIIGGAQEEITLERLWRVAQDDIESNVRAYGGWDHYEEHAEEMSRGITSLLNKTCRVNLKQLQMNDQILPEASKNAQKWSAYRNMAEVHDDFARVNPSAAPAYSGPYEPPMEGSRWHPRMYNKGSAWRSPRNLPARLDRGEVEETTAGAAAPEASTSATIDVADKNVIEQAQTKRMMTRLMNKTTKPAF